MLRIVSELKLYGENVVGKCRYPSNQFVSWGKSFSKSFIGGTQSSAGSNRR